MITPAANPRLPDAIMADFVTAAHGQADLDITDVLFEILDDVIDSGALFLRSLADRGLLAPNIVEDYRTSVSDYVANHYGDS